MKRALLACMIIALAFTAIACTRPENKEVKIKPKVIFVTDVGGLANNRMNDTVWEACSLAAEGFNVDIRCLESESSGAVYENIVTASKDLPALVVTIGADGAAAARKAAASFPEINYTVLDEKISLKNVSSIVFKEQDAAFLAGAAAAMTGKRGSVGCIFDNKSLKNSKMFYGLKAGALAIKSGASVTASYISEDSNETGGMIAAKSLAERGAEVLFTSAGKSRAGIIKYAALKGLKVITVSDSEMDRGTDEDDQNVVMGIVERDVRTAFEKEIESALNGDLSGGAREYGLDDDMIEFDAENGISDSQENVLKKWRKAVIEGKVTVPYDGITFSKFKKPVLN